MAFETILFEKRDKIARITLNRPEKMNAISYQMDDEMTAAIEDVKADGDVSVLVIKGAGPCFTAGHDLNEVYRSTKPYAHKDRILAERQKVIDVLDHTFRQLWMLPQPTIAQVHGYCITQGVELAMSCDLVIAAEDARIWWRPVGGAGRLYSLWPWLIGMRQTKEHLFTGDYFTGADAARLGMINGAVPADRLEDEVNQLAAKIAKLPLEMHTLNKASVNKCFEMMGMRQALEYTAEFHAMSHVLPITDKLEKAIVKTGARATKEREEDRVRGRKSIKAKK